VGAKDFGIEGEVMEIKEKSLLEVIYETLSEYEKDGRLKEFQERYLEKMTKEIKEPKAIRGISFTKMNVKNTKRYFDPTIELKEDIVGGGGELIAARGTRINPLDYGFFGEEWVFIDGRIKEQRMFASSMLKNNQNKDSIKVILVAGVPGEQENGEFYYFDQAGRYSKHFGITKVPSIVRQGREVHEKLIEIEEVSLGR
jgi:conjugal transfer pilus assembly protein TraW